MEDSPEQPARRRSAIRVACRDCRSKKSKCDGQRPVCGTCSRKQISCFYDADPEETPMAALKRRYAHLEERLAEQTSLLDLLKGGEEYEALVILRRYRAGEGLTTIVKAPQTGALGVSHPAAHFQDPVSDTRPNPSSPAMQPPPKRVPIADLLGPSVEIIRPRSHNRQDSAALPSSSQPQYRRMSQPDPAGNPVSGHDLPVGQDRPHPSLRRWRSLPSGLSIREGLLSPSTRKHNTSFTDMHVHDWGIEYIEDDDVLRNVIASFLVWDHPTWSIFDEEAFCEGLARCGSDIVNRFTVNAIVAFGAKIHRTFNPEKVSVDIEHAAFGEAQRLWTIERDIPLEANVIGALVMNSYLDCAGQDRLPTDYMKRAVWLACQLGLYTPELKHVVYDSSGGKERRARSRAVLAWGVHAHQAYVSCTFNEMPLLTTMPPIPVPTSRPEEDDENWFPFPHQAPAKRSLTSSRFAARVELWAIGNGCVPLYQQHRSDPGSNSHLNSAMRLYDRLRRWHDGLDSRLVSLYDAPPHLFQLYTDYHRIILDIFRPFVSATGEANTELRADSRDLVATAYAASSRQTRYLMQELDRQFPELPLPFSTINPLVMVCYDAILHLRHNADSTDSNPTTRSSSQDDSDHTYYLNLSLRMLHRMCPAFGIVPVIMHGLFQVARRQEVALPREAQEIRRKLLGPEMGGIAGHLQHVGSNLPVDLGRMQIDGEKARLGSLIREMRELGLEGGR